MVIYVCETQNGIWIKADPEDRKSINALKIWWTRNGNSVTDYLDRSLTADRRRPVYAILSLGRSKKAIPEFRIKMAEMGVKIKLIDGIELHAITTAEFEKGA